MKPIPKSYYPTIVLFSLLILISACGNDDGDEPTSPSSEFIPIILGSWEDPADPMNNVYHFGSFVDGSSSPFYTPTDDVKGNTPNGEVFIAEISGGDVTFTPDPNPGQEISISEIFTGRFIDLETLYVYRSNVQIFKRTFTPDFTTGVWVNVKDNQHKLKFSGTFDLNTLEGCEIISNSLTNFTASYETLYVFDLEIPRSSETIVLVGKFTGISTLVLSSTDTNNRVSYTFQRMDLADSCI